MVHNLKGGDKHIKTSGNIPEHWPAETRFLTRSIPASNLPPQLKGKYCPSTSSPERNRLYPQRLRIKIIKAPMTHPALGQRGLFAPCKIAARTFVCDYIGIIHTESDADLNSNYDLSMCPHDGVAIDAAEMGGIARCINDYRDIRPRPNVEFKNREVIKMDGSVEVRTSVFTLKDEIKKGDELCLSYGKGFWKARLAE